MHSRVAPKLVKNPNTREILIRARIYIYYGGRTKGSDEGRQRGGQLSHFITCISSALCLEELAHQRAAFFLKHALCDLRFGVEGIRGEDSVAALGVGRAIDEAAELRPADGAGTHDAGLDRDVERALIEVLAPERICGGGDGLHRSESVV